MHQQILRLITLNTWKGDGRYDQRLELMASGLKQLQPNIVCLQESLRTAGGTMDTAGYLAHKLGLEAIFGHGRLKTRSVQGEQFDSHSGLAILSCCRPSSSRSYTLPVCDDDSDRTALTALFNWGGLSLVTTTVHLTHLTGEDDLRRRQLDCVIDESQKFASGPDPDHPMPVTLICGDMNYEIDAEELERRGAENGVVILDGYLEGGGERPGYTFNMYGNFPCRIDYILYIQNEKDRALQISNAKIVLSEKSSDGLLPSDHLGVMVDIALF